MLADPGIIKDILVEYHASLVAGHARIKTTLARLKRSSIGMV